jgi:hypothetical protein
MAPGGGAALCPYKLTSALSKPLSLSRLLEEAERGILLMASGALTSLKAEGLYLQVDIEVDMDIH